MSKNSFNRRSLEMERKIAEEYGFSPMAPDVSPPAGPPRRPGHRPDLQAAFEQGVESAECSYKSAGDTNVRPDWRVATSGADQAGGQGNSSREVVRRAPGSAYKP